MDDQKQTLECAAPGRRPNRPPSHGWFTASADLRRRPQVPGRRGSCQTPKTPTSLAYFWSWLLDSRFPLHHEKSSPGGSLAATELAIAWDDAPLSLSAPIRAIRGSESPQQELQPRGAWFAGVRLWRSGFLLRRSRAAAAVVGGGVEVLGGVAGAVGGLAERVVQGEGQLLHAAAHPVEVSQIAADGRLKPGNLLRCEVRGVHAGILSRRGRMPTARFIGGRI